MKAVNELHQKSLDGRKVFIKMDDALDNNNYSATHSGNYNNDSGGIDRRAGENDFRGGLANGDNFVNRNNERGDRRDFSNSNNSGSNNRNQGKRSRSRGRDDNYRRGPTRDD